MSAPAISDTTTELSRLLREAAASLAAGSPAAALPKALAAQALLVASPDFERDGLSIRWGERIDTFVNQVRREISAGIGVQRTPYQYENPEDVDTV